MSTTETEGVYFDNDFFDIEAKSPILNDYVFKQVFGKQENEKILISFLNAMLNGDYNIKAVKVLNSEFPRIADPGRTILLDVQVQIDDGTYIDIEIQQGYRSDLVDRMFVYGSRMITRYSEQSTPFNSTKCVAIWLLNCNMPEFKQFGNEQIIGQFCFRSTVNPSKYLPLDELKVYPISLKKNTKDLNISSIKETWINFLKNSANRNTVKGVEEINEAYDDMLSVTAKVEYRNYLDALKKADELRRNDSYHARNEGLAEGRAEGKKEGLAEGEHKKAIETAKNMLTDGLLPETVAKYTGLSIEEVKKLL